MPRQADPLTAVRRERFRDYCIRRGWQKPSGGWDRAEIAKATKKAPAQVGNMLSEGYSFAGALSRELEETLGLPAYYFDGVDTSWPFSQQLRQEVAKLGPNDMVYAENALRAHLKMESLPTFALKANSTRGAA